MRTSRAVAALLCCSALLFAARAPKKVPAKVAKDSKPKVNPVIQKWMRSLTLRDKIAQLVVMPCYGEAINTRSAVYRRYVHEVRDLKIGGLIVMGHVQGGAVHNAEPFAMTAFLNRMQRLAKVPLLVSSDFERGASMRVNSTTAWPHNMAFAAARDLDDTRFEGAFTAKEARALGVNWVFAPDADVNNNPDNPVINTRSYSENPEEVAAHVKAYIEGAHSDPKNIVLVTVKHFPGHGDTAEDSHLGLARLDADKTRINAVELAPFRAAIAAGVDSVMTAHMAVPALEPENIPATVSSNILTALLRKDLNFQGITVTDAMDMRGLSQLFPVGEASVRAIEAGDDVLLMPLNADEAIKAVVAAVDSGRLTKQRIDESVLRVLTAKAQVGLPNRRFVNVEGVGDVIQSPEADERAQNVADRAVTLVRNEGKTLPLADPDKSCVVILTEHRNRQQGTHIMDEIRRRNTKMNVSLLDPSMSKEDLDAAQNAPGCDAIVIVAYANVSSYRGNVALPGEFTGFVNTLLSGATPVAMISLGNPYLVRSFPNVKTYIATFSTAATSETAAVKTLFGEIPITGHLPVTIPGVAKYGDGIQTPATRQALPPTPTARIQTKHPNRKGS
jgi:beta-N-acetylhexosaminidase